MDQLDDLQNEANIEEAYIESSSTLSTQLRLGDLSYVNEENQEFDDRFDEFLDDINVSYLQTSVLHYDDEDRELMEAVHLMVEDVRSRLRSGGDLIHIGSCQDGTKIKRLDELDLLYVLPKSVDYQIIRRDVPHKFDVCDGLGNLVCPRRDRQQFADEVDEIFKHIFLPHGLEHCGCVSPSSFSGVRYNGPAVTTLFTWQKTRNISIDMTQVLQLPAEERAALQTRIKDRCKRVFDENPQRLFHIKSTYLYPNIVTNCWELSTAYCEADMLSNLASDSPFKTTIQLAKLICHRLAEHNVQTFSRMFTITTSAQTNLMLQFLLRLEGPQTTPDLEPLRYGHAFLLPEHGSNFNELTKKLISINTAAVKHITLWTASKIPGSFAPSPPSTNILRYLLSEIFIYLASGEYNIQHFLVDSFISLFAVAPWAVAGIDSVGLVRVLQWQCRRIAWTVYPERFGLADLPTHIHDLQQYVLPPGELCAEDTCKIDVDFTGKRCNVTFNVLVKLINALANSYGGVILLNGPKCSDATTQIWEKAFIQHLRLFLSETSMPLVSVSLGSDHGPPYIYVQRSGEILILNPNITTFKKGIPQMLRDPEALVHVLCHQVADGPERAPLVTKDSYTLGENIGIMSGLPVYCSEFKLRTQLRARYVATRLIQLPLFAMQNTTSGGLIILGAKEVQGKVLITGVKLEREKQAFFEHILTSIFEQCPVTKQKRICGESHLDGQSDRDTCCTIKFHHITDATDRIVVSIHLKFHPRGFFTALPEVYTLSPEGVIEPMLYTALKSSIESRRVIAANLPQQNGPSSPPEDQLTGTDDSTHDFRMKNTEPEVTETSIATPKDVKQKVEPYLQRTTELSWSEHIDDWRQNLTFIRNNLTDNSGKLAGSDLFHLHKPIKFSPPASVLYDACPLLTPELLKIITKNHPRAGFGIGASTLSSLCTGGPTRQDSRGLDLLVIDETSDIHIWLVSGAVGQDQIMKHRKYVTTLGIVLKKHILNEIDRNETKNHKTQNIHVHCHMLLETGEQVDIPIQSIVTQYSNNTTVPLGDICWALARVFLSKDTMLKNRIGRDIAIHLTAQQFEQEIQSMFRKFNIVEGPPGSGKTILAIRMYRSFAEGKAIFIASNAAMQAFVDYQGVTTNAVIHIAQDVDKLLDSGILLGRECVILDDVQHLVFKARTWTKLFDFMSGSDARLYAFMDNSCQSFNITRKPDSFLYHLEHYCEKRNVMLNVRHLDEVHRNSKKVVSYIKECHSQMCNIPCSSLQDGDDVNIIKMANTKETTAKNPLVEYVNSLTESPLEWTPARSYLATDIAVLVDGSTSEADAELYRTILRDHGRFTVQAADVFPVEGIIVDTVDKFVGLDADVVIFMTSEDLHGKQPQWTWRHKSGKRRLTNEKYKAFISSRAVSKLVFVIQSDITFEITETLHLSSERITKTMEKSMAEDQSDVHGVKEIWHVGKQAAYTNACFLRMAHGLVLICVTYRPNMHLISVETGEELPLGDIGVSIHTARKAEISASQKYLAVLWNEVDHDKVRWRWSICSVEPKGFRHMYTHAFNRMPTSVCWTPEDDLLFIVYESKYREPRLQKYRIDGQMVWNFQDDVTKFDVPEDLAVSASGKMYVPEYYNHNVRVLSPKGHFRQNIPATSDDCRLRSPKAVCVDSTGRWLWVAHRPTNRQQVSLVSIDGKKIIPVIETKKAVFSLDIHDATFLAVGTRNGLVLYDISSVYTIFKL